MTERSRLIFLSSPAIRLCRVSIGYPPIRGLSDETRLRLVEPQFTTKVVGRSNGLGLATVRAIIRQHGGTSAVETALGAGTTFPISQPTI